MARPRKHPPGSATAQARAREAALQAAGGRRMTLLLSPQANADLEAARRPGEAANATISRALAALAGRTA